MAEIPKSSTIDNVVSSAIIEKVIDEIFTITNDSFQLETEISIGIYLRVLLMNFVDVLERTPDACSLTTVLKFFLVAMLELDKVSHYPNYELNIDVNIQRLIRSTIAELCTFKNGPTHVATETYDILSQFEKYLQQTKTKE